jgi:competence ComEA-like helix-hairpin-helix protein
VPRHPRTRHPLTPLLLTAILLLCACATTATTRKPPTHPININTAQSAELQQVPGIGPSTAEKILQTRKSYGSFKTVDDLLSIRGIGPQRLEKMRKYLTVARASSREAAKSISGGAHPARSPATTTTTRPAAKPVTAKLHPKPGPADSTPVDDEEPE